VCATLGLEHLANDERFAVNQQRYVNRHVLWPLLEEAFLAKPAQAWVSELLAAEIPAAVVNSLDESLSDPQVLHRSMVLELHPGGLRKTIVAVSRRDNLIATTSQSRDGV
jgi:CoA:oxalate CoA-transferase